MAGTRKKTSGKTSRTSKKPAAVEVNEENLETGETTDPEIAETAQEHNDNSEGPDDVDQSKSETDSQDDQAKEFGAIEEPQQKVAAEPEAQAAKASGGRVLPSIFGGAIAAAIGFGAAQIYPDGWPFGSDEQLVELQGQQSELGQRLTDTEASVFGLADQTTQSFTSVESANKAVLEELAALKAEVAELREELAAKTVSENPELLSEELRATLESQKSEIARVQSELEQMSEVAQAQIQAAELDQARAVDAEARAEARGAVNLIRSALGTGESFNDSLPVLAKALEVPDALTSVAADGVVVQSELQSQFPDLARAALSQTIDTSSASTNADRLSLFLRDQFGMRSLAPRDGDDPDAVLSRVEESIRQGDLASAIAGLDALPDEGKRVFSDWVQAASSRMMALEALEDVSAELSGS